MQNTHCRNLAFSLVVLAMLVLASRSDAQDLKVEDITAKHLDSIGTKDKRLEVKSRFAMGTSAFESKLPKRRTEGKALIVSEGANLLFITSFLSKEYPFEKIGYFNDKINLPYVTAGTRSPLGAFIADHEKMLSDGLFTGSMSSTWVLHDPQVSKGRLIAAGTKKVNGRKAYVLDYFPKSSGAEFTIKIYIDSETFNHIQTEYRHEIAPKAETFGTLGAQTGVKLSVIENFDDFKTIDGLTLPYSYGVKYLSSSNSGVYEYVWGVKVTEYRINQKLTPDFFTFDTK